MQVKNEDDFKYVLQDFDKYYIGARYNYNDLIELDIVPFKFKTIIGRYLTREIDKSTTIESHIYFMEKESDDYRAYKQLRAKVRFVEVITDKKSGEDRYKETILPIDKFVKISVKEKMDRGIVVREIDFSKLSLMTFQV